VSISGGQKPAVRMQANPGALASYGLSLEALRTALGSASVNQAKGNFDGPDQDYQIDANDQLADQRRLRMSSSPIATARRCASSDVATVVDGAENTKQAAWMNARPAIILNIQRQPGANIISVVDSIKAAAADRSQPARAIKVTKLTT
jgi:multidrug efflux pump